MAMFIKNFFASILFLIYAKGPLKLQYLCKTTGLATKQTIVLIFLEVEGIAVMKWPSQSPDVTPIEHVWEIIGEKAQNRNSQSIDELWGFLKEEWESITTTFCKMLIGSCGRRYNEIIQCKGKFTKD